MLVLIYFAHQMECAWGRYGGGVLLLILGSSLGRVGPVRGLRGTFTPMCIRQPRPREKKKRLFRGPTTNDMKK
jgi:hypothetical protein